jgi:hypothetical protein
MMRIVAAAFFALLSIVAALVAWPVYWGPVTVSLLAAGASVWFAYPSWKEGRHRLLLAIAGFGLAVVSAHTLMRLGGLIASALG